MQTVSVNLRYINMMQASTDFKVPYEANGDHSTIRRKHIFMLCICCRLLKLRISTSCPSTIHHKIYALNETGSASRTANVSGMRGAKLC